MQMLNYELPFNSQLPVTMFRENAVQGTHQCMFLLRQMASLCNTSVGGDLKFPDDRNDGKWLDWKQWFDRQHHILSSEIQDSPTDDFVKSCCTLCNKLTRSEEMESHPIFANRKICKRHECRDREEPGARDCAAGVTGIMPAEKVSGTFSRGACV